MHGLRQSSSATSTALSNTLATLCGGAWTSPGGAAPSWAPEWQSAGSKLWRGLWCPGADALGIALTAPDWAASLKLSARAAFRILPACGCVTGLLKWAVQSWWLVIRRFLVFPLLGYVSGGKAIWLMKSNLTNAGIWPNIEYLLLTIHSCVSLVAVSSWWAMLASMTDRFTHRLSKFYQVRRGARSGERKGASPSDSLCLQWTLMKLYNRRAQTDGSQMPTSTWGKL